MTEPAGEQREELLELRAKLQARVLEAAPVFESKTTAKAIFQAIKKALLEAYDDSVLDTPTSEIFKHIGMGKPDKHHRVKLWGGLVKGKKPQKRRPEDARLRRFDGAWLHFTLTLQCADSGKYKGKHVEGLHAYDFELVFPEGHVPPFVRFDLNEPDHPNEERELRSHVHPGNDDLLLPAPFMSPNELIDVLLRRLRNPRNADKPRA